MLSSRFWLPKTENDFRPDGLQRRAVLIMALLVTLTFLGSNMWALLWQQSQWLVGAVLPAVVVTETNIERANQELVALKRNPVLDEAAKLKAEDMANNGYFAHYSPTGVSPWHWFNKVDYSFVHAGENLAVHFTDSDTVVDAWMKSPTHRANIVNANFTEIGVGTAKGRYQGFDTIFVVQLFGTRAVPIVKGESTTANNVTEGRSTDLQKPEQQLIATSEDLTPIAVMPIEDVAGITSDNKATDTIVNDGDVPVMELPNYQTDVTSDGVLIFTDTIASSTNLTPAPISNSFDQTNFDSSNWAKLTSSRWLMQILYVVFGVVVVGLLLTSVFVEWKQHRPRQIIYGVGLLLLMSILFYIHLMVTSFVTVL